MAAIGSALASKVSAVCALCLPLKGRPRPLERQRWVRHPRARARSSQCVEFYSFAILTPVTPHLDPARARKATEGPYELCDASRFTDYMCLDRWN